MVLLLSTDKPLTLYDHDHGVDDSLLDGSRFVPLGKCRLSDHERVLVLPQLQRAVIPPSPLGRKRVQSLEGQSQVEGVHAFSSSTQT